MGSSVGKGGNVKGGGGSAALDNLANTLATQSQTLFQEAQPTTKELFGQVLNSLQTGGIGPGMLPIAQKGVEASRAATSKALQETGEMGAAFGGGRGSSALLRTMGDIALSGELASAAIPQQIAQQFISAAPTLTTGTTQQALGFGTSAGGIFNQAQNIQASRDIAKGNQQSQMLQGMLQMGGGLGGVFT